MRYISVYLLFLFVLLSQFARAQPPQLIPYQAIARDNAGNPILNQNIGLRFSIHDQTISGTVVWQESQTVVSNNLGIIVTALGGTTQLTSVDWGSGSKFLQVEMDIAGGTNYLDMGTQQMMSVPYALYAETSGSVVNNGGGGNGSFTHWIGELYGGGIICHLWKDAQGVEHGLIASLNNLGEAPIFSSNLLENANSAVSRLDGWQNTIQLLNQGLPANSAVFLCFNYVSESYDDWYLPAYQELIFLYKNIFDLNLVLSTNSNFDLIGAYNDQNSPIDGYSYWSSTLTSYAWANGCAIRVLEPTFGSGWSSNSTNYCFEFPLGLNAIKQVRAFRKF